MKTSILILDGVKQINFTPETEHEKQILKLITPNDKIEVEFKTGGFTDNQELIGMRPYFCNGGWNRIDKVTNESLMFIIKPKE